jgi:Bacterial protein of unknown function (HtrL_YibB)
MSQTHATVVTAYYPIKSKFPPQQYLEWAARFLQMSAPIVFYTTAVMLPVFQKMRTSRIHYVVREFADLDVWRLYKDHWIHAHTLDHEAAYHTPELYAVWASKAFFMEEAATRNPFGTDYFYWCDVGAFRDPTQPPHPAFPSAARLAEHLGTQKIVLSSVEPLGTARSAADFKHVNRIVGGLWGGHRDAIRVWRSAYEQALLQYFLFGHFAGKDQSVMLSAALAHPELVEIVEPTVDGNRWFFTQRLLSDPAVPWKRDESYKV